MLLRNGHVLPSMIRGGESVVAATDAVDRVVDFLLGASLVIGKKDVLGQVCKLLFSARIRILSIRHTEADGDVGACGICLNQTFNPFDR
jgi:hypothetical protein